MYERNYHTRVLDDETQSKPQAGGKKRKKIFPWKQALLVSCCVVLVGGFITLAKLKQFQLTNVEVVGVESADPKDVSEFVMNSLEGRWLYIFPKTSLVLLPDASLEKTIRRAFPKFSDVSVARSGRQSIVIEVKEYVGTSVWCDEVTQACSFMNDDGVVFAPAPFFSGSAYIKFFGGQAGAYPFVPLPVESLATMKFLSERLSAINIEASEFYFYTKPEKLVVVFYHNGNPAKIIIDTEISLDTTLQSLFTAIRTPAFSVKYKSSTAMLEYIDLRLSNKVVYKFK